MRTAMFVLIAIAFLSGTLLLFLESETSSESMLYTPQNDGIVQEVQQTPQFKDFLLRDGEVGSDGANFAGSYLVSVKENCGEECQMWSIVNLTSGEVLIDDLVSYGGLLFATSSTLLVVNDTFNNEVGGQDFYSLEGEELLLLLKMDEENGLQRVSQCPSLEVEATHPITGERRTFSSWCHIPVGWEMSIAGE